jgi:hypothetical protein
LLVDEAGTPTLEREYELFRSLQLPTLRVWTPQATGGGVHAYVAHEPSAKGREWKVYVSDKWVVRKGSAECRLIFDSDKKPNRVVIAPDGKHLAVVMADAVHLLPLATETPKREVLPLPRIKP